MHLQWYHNEGHLAREIMQGEPNTSNKGMASDATDDWWMTVTCLPFSTTEKCLPCCFHPLYGPCSTPVGCTTIHCTLVNKHKLICFVRPYLNCKVSTFLYTLFECYTRKLDLLLVVDTQSDRFTTYLFHAIAPLDQSPPYCRHCYRDSVLFLQLQP